VIVLVVPREAAGARLDRFLAHALAATERAPSRSELQKWIEHGRVRVDGRVKKAPFKLVEGARVDVEPEEPAKTEALPEEGIAFDVLYVDDAVVVLCKPAGLVVHPAHGNETGTLVNGLLARGYFAATALSGAPGAKPSAREVEGHERPGIVHRLDKGTSGVMVVARTPEAREKLRAQFSAHTIEREYVAICVGEVSETVHRTLYGRHSKDRMRFTSRVREGKTAVTHVRVIERLHGATHVACRLETGRTHQIRVHLAESGTPVLGDPVYGKPPKDARLRELAEELGHQALHARVLGFVHPTTGEHVRFEAEPPQDFVATLATLAALAKPSKPPA
jgi:23S rRNA pseudouridine1911/1915/1917 synthase